MPTRVDNVYDITIEIVGRWAASKDVVHWPFNPDPDIPKDKPLYEDFIHINGGSNLTIRGGGKVDGRGYHWWKICWRNVKRLIPWQGSRPHLIRIEKFTNIKIHDIIMKNSAQFHLKMDECYDAELYNIDIKVNTTAQVNLLKKLSFEGTFIIFPLNTDGIDPHGARMHIYNLTVQNFDDVVVPKPGTKIDMGAQCT